VRKSRRHLHQATRVADRLGQPGGQKSGSGFIRGKWGVVPDIHHDFPPRALGANGPARNRGLKPPAKKNPRVAGRGSKGRHPLVNLRRQSRDWPPPPKKRHRYHSKEQESFMDQIAPRPAGALSAAVSSLRGIKGQGHRSSADPSRPMGSCKPIELVEDRQTRTPATAQTAHLLGKPRAEHRAFLVGKGGTSTGKRGSASPPPI